MGTNQTLEIHCENDTEFAIDKNWIETALNEYCRMINHKAKFTVSNLKNNANIYLSGNIDIRGALRQQKLDSKYLKI